MAKASKGSAFERDFCRQLSLWWSKDWPDGPVDDLFWRTSNSGGRATTRAKQGKGTRNHYGDICATDEKGKPFTDWCVVELKRGYNIHTFADLLDTQEKGKKKPLYRQWIEKTAATAKQAGVPAWLLVVRRDRRNPIVIIPYIKGYTTIVPNNEALLETRWMRIIDIPFCHIFPLSEFFALTSPKGITDAVQAWNAGKNNQ